MNEPTHLDLFSGIGGFALAARWAGFRTVGFCEIEPYAQRVLEKNFHCHPNGHSESNVSVDAEVAELPRIHSDIFTLDGTQYRGVSLITGGFPCQPFSCAGKRRGKEDDRHLWPQMLRVISEARPAWVVGENVTGIVSMELDSVLSDLEAIGYACRPFIIPACGVDARHRRNRVWIMAHRNEQGSQGRNGQELRERAAQRTARAGDSPFPDASRELLNGTRRTRNGRGKFTDRSRWLSEPNVGGSTDGLPARLDEAGLDENCKTRAREILRDVRSATFTEAFQWTLGRFDGVSEAEVLLAFLCEYEAQPDAVRFAMESRTTAERFMRSLWINMESARSPYRREYCEQSAQEYSDALRQLSREAPSLFPQAWEDDCWEDEVQRVAHGIPKRVDRLRGLGNAIVPQVAYQILCAIKQSEACLQNV